MRRCGAFDATAPVYHEPRGPVNLPKAFAASSRCATAAARPAAGIPGRAGRIALKLAIEGFRRLGRATAHDALVARHLAEVLTGGETDATACVSEPALLELERRALLALIRTPATLARMEHLLDTGKPLRN